MPPEKPMIDARLTIEPPPRFFMYGIAVRAQMKLAFGSRSSPWSHSSPVSPVALLRTARPALFTRISMPPYCFSTSPRACTTAFSSVTSQPVAMSRIATLAPACSKSRAVAAPMPPAPPVMTATFPSTLNTSMETGSVYSAGVHDLLIRNALLLDGLGSPPVRGDLAVSDGKITGVGAVDASAKETIEADGLALMPGIIDNHTHYDAQITWDPWVSPSPALGVATSTSPAHNGAEGRPMPSRLADERELAALVGSLREVGRGLFMLTKGGQTRMSFLESLAAESGRPVVVAALLHSSTQPEGVFQDLDAIAAANARGRRLVGAVSCCPLSMDFTLRSPYTFEGLDAWQAALPLKGEAYQRKLTEPAFRQAVRQEIERPAHFRLFNGEWHKVHVVESARPHVEQRSIAELAAEARKDPLDYMLDLALTENLETVFSALLLNSDEAAVGRMLRDPHALVSLSDAGAHLTFFNDSGFGLHLLGHWSRELGVLSLAEAAWRLSGHPAKIYGIRNRGALRPGFHADLLLFDPQTVNRGPNRRVFDLPADQPRLTADAIGVHGVW